MNTAQQRFTLGGGCHCGQLRLHYFSPLPAEKILVRVCQCTFCQRHGGRYTSHAESRLEILADNEASLNRYRFGTSTADFLMCANCGVVVAALSVIDGQLCAVVNTSTFDDFPVVQDNVSEHDFGGESLEYRLARRKRNWIPDVSLNIKP